MRYGDRQYFAIARAEDGGWFVNDRDPQDGYLGKIWVAEDQKSLIRLIDRLTARPLPTEEGR